MCDTFCVRRPGGMLFAKSSDRPVDEAQVVEWWAPRPAPAAGATVRVTHVAVPDARAAGLVGSRPGWMWGLEHGLNEHGVAIGNEKVWTVDDPRAVPPALLGVHGQGGSGEEHHDEPYWSSFLVVDGDGGWVLETSGRSWVARPVGEGAAISNRLTIGTDWVRGSDDVAPGADWDARRDPAAPTGIADHRLAATRACVARGPSAGPAEAVAALRDHGSGPWGAPGERVAAPPAPPEDVRDDWSGVTVCMHVRDYQCTTASMVVDLPGRGTPAAPRRAWASLGTACTGVFLPVAVLAAAGGPEGAVGVVPEVLGDVTAWRAFARLGRAVEVPGGAGATSLAAIREALGPVEAAAWNEGDELWSAGAGPDVWRSAADRWSREVRAVLEALAPSR